MKRGEHYITPKIVEERYIISLKLLNHYFEIPDNVSLIDNSDVTCLIVEKIGKLVKVLPEHLPVWITQYLQEHFQDKKEEQKTAKDLSSKEEVRELYKKSLNKENPM